MLIFSHFNVLSYTIEIKLLTCFIAKLSSKSFPSKSLSGALNIKTHTLETIQKEKCIIKIEQITECYKHNIYKNEEGMCKLAKNITILY